MNLYEQLQNSKLTFEQIQYLNEFLKKNLKAFEILGKEYEYTLDQFKAMKGRLSSYGDESSEIHSYSIQNQIDYLHKAVEANTNAMNKIREISELWDKFVSSIEPKEGGEDENDKILEHD